jgi:hypothetical protein
VRRCRRGCACSRCAAVNAALARTRMGRPAPLQCALCGGEHVAKLCPNTAVGRARAC